MNSMIFPFSVLDSEAIPPPEVSEARDAQLIPTSSTRNVKPNRQAEEINVLGVLS